MIFYAWLVQDKIPIADCTSNDVTGKSPNMKSTEEYLQLVKTVLIDKDLRTMKIHQTKHYEFYIKRLGVPSIFNGSIGERHQKSIVKNPGTTIWHTTPYGNSYISAPGRSLLTTREFFRVCLIYFFTH